MPRPLRDLRPSACLRLPGLAPERVAAAFAQQPGTLWLDSADDSGWSYLLVDPVEVFLSEPSGVFGQAPSRLAALQHEVGPAPGPDEPPFVGGLAGLFGYELGRALEPVLADRPEPEAGPTLPPLWLGLYRDILAFAPRGEGLHLRCLDLGSGPPPASRMQRWRARLGQLPPLGPLLPPTGTVAQDLDAATYAGRVAQIIDRIGEGELFQANLSQRFSVAGPRDGFDLYRRLRSLARPAQGAFLQLGGGRWVACASPERLVAVRGGEAEAAPIKGTRPRSPDPTEDARLAAELLASEKDRAENTMIVDLLRNDLSRVCADGSISVPELCALRSLPTVHHLVSRVRGRLRAAVGPFDLIAALFPGGSITGAPKIQAMRVIAELEDRRRGPYCGSLGWIGLNGDLDLNIAIRTAVPHSDGRVGYNAGGGVIFASDPWEEQAETRDKARAFCLAATGQVPWEEPGP